MIRNVTILLLRTDHDPALADRALKEIRTLQVDGMVQLVAGRDMKLKDGAWDLVITADFVDAAAYRRYDEDDEHNRMRRELFGPISQQIARAQFELPG
jgi:Stress responsive A/B Barrel Domain